MGTTTKQRFFTPEQAAEQLSGLMSAGKLRKLCREGRLTHHRGGRNEIFLSEASLAEIEDMTVRRADTHPELEVIADEHESPAPDPFRTTPRSRAAHARKTA